MTNCKTLLVIILVILLILLCCDVVMKEMFVAPIITPTTGSIDMALHTTSVHNDQITAPSLIIPPIIQLDSVDKINSMEHSKHPAIGFSPY